MVIADIWKIQKKYKEVEKKKSSIQSTEVTIIYFLIRFYTILPWCQDLVTLYTMNISACK